MRTNALAKALPALVRDAVGLGGCVSLAYGAWLAWHPLGFMVAGAFGVTGALVSARAQ